MIPIYEQGSGKGIGLNCESFLQRFETLCQEHLRTHRAKSFAFIFYDSRDHELKELLKEHGVFTQLDRRSGSDLSVFYLFSPSSKKTIDTFNDMFLSKLKVTKATLPCVVFFKLKDDEVADVLVAQLDSADLVYGFHELYGVIDNYIKNDLTEIPKETRYVKWFKSGAILVSKEVFEGAVRALLNALRASVIGG